MVGEGSAATFDQLQGVLKRALTDRAPLDPDEAFRVDAELRRAGITPGHASLYGGFGDPPEGSGDSA